MSSPDEPQSIKALYAAAEAARAALEARPDPRSPAYADAVASTLAAYAACRERVGAAALFSPNESFEDVATAALPYLVLDLRRADVVQRTPYADPPQRRLVVRRARAAYESFLALADGYGLVTGRHAALLARYRDEPDTFAVAGGADAPARREAKMAAFRAEKELKRRLDMLRADPRYQLGDGDGDEDVVRQAHLAAVHLGVHAALQGLESLNREMEMLAMAPESVSADGAAGAAGDANSRRRDTEDDATWRLDAPLRRGPGTGPLLSAQGRPLQPFTLVGSRADLRAGVFRAGHNLPTMSIDEYLDEEARRGNILSGGTDPVKPAVDEDDNEAVDRETYKAREWDDFKDENRRGAGNTMNVS
ncbi:TOR signaling pathway regulator (TapA), putative [Cordyceps militaris CM01]|uniref:TOR signaling pathway regulator (TapA), putative n=1 Tax=Cordyceps militaris (strain CM01) TaxID=983644 RepID=G3JE92_CORMM|nr:TOR signaling pathway regulator (TapA), putative [Cordyceps militaris CM01]EGX92917.1 TOR signaling pathway regulator (TapA), putative [Cordyceps militaris CM01]